jgi:hypothetical protein
MSNAPKRFETLRTAYDVKWVHRELADVFRDDELQRISLLPRGHRLEQGATYFDLCDGRDFRATADQVVARDGCVVAKSDLDYELWNRLLHVKVSPTDPRAIRPRSRKTGACAHCGVEIVDPVVQVIHGDLTFCCANCAEAMEQPGLADHLQEPRCAHCGTPIVHKATMERRADRVFCCSNCAAAAAVQAR